MTDDGHDPGPVPLTERRLVPLENNIEHPVQLVLDASMSSEGFGGSWRPQPTGGDV